MTAPLPLPSIAPASPAPVNDARGAKPAAGNKKDKGPAFSDVLAQQRPAQQQPNQAADARPANGNSKTPSKDGKPSDPAATAEGAAAGAINDAVQTAAQAEAGALAVAAQLPVAPSDLPQQALEIAAQAAEQVQLARGNAAAAVTAMNQGAGVLTAALNAADTLAPQAAQQTPVAATAGQAQDAAAQIARDAEAAMPVLTAAVKPGSAPVAQAPADPKATVKAEAPKAAADLPLPRVARETPADPAAPAPQTHVADEDQPDLLAGTTPQFQAPQHGATPHEALGAALAAATQRQALPVVNQAALAQPVVPVVLQVATPVGATHWGTELGQQMVMMSNNVRQGMQTAELRLDPPDLGPLRVSLNLADGVASASFVSAHASVRQAIEVAIPQLQQALAQAGISLGQTSVGEQAAQQEFAQQNGSGSQRQQGGNAVVADGVAESAQPAVTVSRNANALVDTFA